MLADCRAWDALDASPVLRHQMVELVAVGTLAELAEGWGFDSDEAAREYVRGPFERRVLRDAGAEAVEFLHVRCAERGI